jgi:hypothetical protein
MEHHELTQQDEQYLKLLSIFHFVVAGITGLFACFPIFHLIVGVTMLAGGFDPAPKDENFPFQLFGLMFVLIPAFIILLGWALAVAIALTGYFLLKRRNYMFCLIVACVECIFMPFGTVLGVFTIIMLLRPAVKAIFEGQPATGLSAPS